MSACIFFDLREPVFLPITSSAAVLQYLQAQTLSSTHLKLHPWLTMQLYSTPSLLGEGKERDVVSSVLNEMWAITVGVQRPMYRRH